MTALLATPSDQPAPAVRKWLVAAAVLLGAILQILDSSIVNVALPYMQRSFGVGVERVTWVVTSYLVAVSIMVPMTGWAAVRIGRKRYFLASVVLFVVSSALCGVSRSINEMVVFRVLQGAAGAAMMPLSQAILLETFPPEEHTLAMTTFGMGMMVAPVFGPTLGGWITMHWNWRWIFYINVPTGALGALMVSVFVHDPHYLRAQRGSGRVDFAGIFLITLALGSLQLILARGGSLGWFASPLIRYGAALSALAMILLIAQELHSSDPIVDLRIFKVFGFTLAIAILMIQALALFSVNLLNPLFMESVLGFDAWKAGLAVAPRGIGVMLALLTIGQLSRRGYDTRPLVCGGFVLGAFEVWRMSHWRLDSPLPDVLWPIFLFGLGLGAVFPTVTALGLGQIRRERMGFAASLFSLMINTGAAAGIAIMTNLLTARHRIYQQHLEVHAAAAAGSNAWLMAYNDIYRMLALVALALAPWAMLLRRSPAGEIPETIVE